MLHERRHDPLVELDRALDALIAAGAGVLVLAAATGANGYDNRPVLDTGGWRALGANLARLDERAAQRGIRTCLHPHVGTMIETRDEVHRLLEESDVPLCLDTVHLLVGGCDPAELARLGPERIVHTHLKDVDEAVAARVRRRDISYPDAVRTGLYRAHWVPATSTSRESSPRSRGAATRAGTSSSRTPS